MGGVSVAAGIGSGVEVGVGVEVEAGTGVGGTTRVEVGVGGGWGVGINRRTGVRVGVGLGARRIIWGVTVAVEARETAFIACERGLLQLKAISPDPASRIRLIDVNDFFNIL